MKSSFNRNKLKKILIISCVFPPEPVVSATISMDVAQEMSKQHEVTVISPKPTRPINFKFSEYAEPLPFKHIIADSYTHPESGLYGRMKESYSFGKWCQNLIEKNHTDFDVIYMNSWPMFSQAMISKVAENFKIPLVTHVMDIYPESAVNKLPAFREVFYKALLPVDKKILHRSKKILAISENMKVHLAKTRNLDEKKITVITNWQNEGDFIKYRQKKLKSAGETLAAPFTFMYLGNNGPVAGVEFLIEAFHKAAIPNSRLIIAGGGSKKEDCENLASRLDASNVLFMPVPEGKVPEIQDMADVMLLPVKKNGAYSSIPSKLPAYMFSAKPIIGSIDVDSDTAKAIAAAECGIVVEPESEKHLIDAMVEISNWDKNKFLESGKKGFDYALKNFSRASNLKKITDIISESI